MEQPANNDPPKLQIKPQVGDGELPNRYWVYLHSDWLENSTKDPSMFDWGRDVHELKPGKSKFLGRLNTFAAAQKAMDKAALECSPPSLKNEYFHGVSCDDRLTGEVASGLYSVCHHLGEFGPTYTITWEWRTDTKFTKEKMEEKGEKFI